MIFNKNSILFTITITFIVSFILIFISFFVLYNSSSKREKHFQEKRNSDVVRIFMSEYRFGGITKDLKQNLKEMGFSIISDFNEQEKILNNKSLKIKKFKKRNKGFVKLLQLNNNNMIFINTPRCKVILKNNINIKNQQNVILMVFLTILISFIVLYFTTIKKLKPLKILKDKVKNFGDEDFDINCSTNKEDEISLLANEFDKSAKKLKKIKESRNVFIRNIMHELKTPITKGKFLTQLSQTKENTDKMQKVFYRLETLINEFATIEELISVKKTLNKKPYYLEDIIDNSIDLLMCDEDNIKKEFKNLKINVDFKLFSIAIKNLLDNGIKYSANKKVKIKTFDNQIVFENLGEKLKYPLENYFEPFFKGDNIKSNQSFGLGLYIVKHILEANDCSFKYEYKNETNKFIIKNKIYSR